MSLKSLEEDKKFAISSCKMLYSDMKLPCTETCACWGFEHGDGWNGVVRELSVKLEMLNLMFYPKFGVRVVMDQCKEKFGTLHYYFHVETVSPLIYRILNIPFEFAYRLMQRNIDFNLKTVIDKKGYYSDEKTEIPSDSVENERKKWGDCENVKIEEVNGKWIMTEEVWHCPVMHTEPTKHKILYGLMRLIEKLDIYTKIYVEPTRKQTVIAEAVESIAEQYVREAEEKCYNTCEDCGTQIGTEWSKRVETKGWISYICDKCDIKRNIVHSINSLKYDIERGNTKLNEDDIRKIEEIDSLVNGEDYHDIEEYKGYYDTVTGIASAAGNGGNGR